MMFCLVWLKRNFIRKEFFFYGLIPTLHESLFFFFFFNYWSKPFVICLHKFSNWLELPCFIFALLFSFHIDQTVGINFCTLNKTKQKEQINIFIDFCWIEMKKKKLEIFLPMSLDENGFIFFPPIFESYYLIVFKKDIQL